MKDIPSSTTHLEEEDVRNFDSGASGIYNLEGIESNFLLLKWDNPIFISKQKLIRKPCLPLLSLYTVMCLHTSMDMWIYIFDIATQSTTLNQKYISSAR